MGDVARHDVGDTHARPTSSSTGDQRLVALFAYEPPSGDDGTDLCICDLGYISDNGERVGSEYFRRPCAA